MEKERGIRIVLAGNPNDDIASANMRVAETKALFPYCCDVVTPYEATLRNSFNHTKHKQTCLKNRKARKKKKRKK